jgi:WD40 repeat protein
MKKLILIGLLIAITQIGFTQSETDTLRLVLPFGQNEEFEIKELFVSSKGNVLASLSESDSDRIIIYNSLTGTAITQFFFDSLNISIDKLSLSPGGRLALTASGDRIYILI